MDWDKKEWSERHLPSQKFSACVSISPLFKNVKQLNLQFNLHVFSVLQSIPVFLFISEGNCILMVHLKYIYKLNNSNNNQGRYLLVTYSEPGIVPSVSFSYSNHLQMR